MTDDARGLLAAIVADPADDTARLAYADCIEEGGNAARAEFIRVQVEAERLHPDANARLALESRAEALFAEHWIDWWSEVCEVTGLPIPAHSPSTRLGRLARRVGLGTPRGDPYQLTGVSVRAPSRRPIDGWQSATFQRGFPDALHVSVPFPNLDLLQSTLKLWTREFPLTSLTITNPFGWELPDQPLARVRSLTLLDYDHAALGRVLQSRLFPDIEDLTLRCNEYANGQGIVERLANRSAEAVRLLRGRNLKRLSLQVWTDRVAAAVAEAAHLASLTALEVDL